MACARQMAACVLFSGEVPMSDNPVLAVAKFAAFVGLKAAHGYHAAHGPAKIAAQIPVIGPVLGVGVLAAAAVAGAVHGISEYDG